MMCFLLAAQFAYRNGLCCTDALLTISHHLQNSLDAVLQSYIVQLDFIVLHAFDRVSHSGLIQIEVYWCKWHCAVHL